MANTASDTEYTPPPLPLPFTNPESPAPVLLTQGAEAHVYKTYFLATSNAACLKVRPLKPYRHPILDRRLTRQRILQEARCLAKLVREGVDVPGVLALDWEGDAGTNGSGNGGAWLLMEWVDGLVVRQVVHGWEKSIKSKGQDSDSAEVAQSEGEVRELLRKIGRAVGGMHKAGIIHGDLTTSNLILRPVGRNGVAPSGGSEIDKPSLDGEIVLIDFGLAMQSVQEEDRAVDLYVLERAFGSTHPKTEGFFQEVVDAYGKSFKGANTVLKRLEAVRMRGRKRSMIG
ncbi:BUD32 protein kinase [Polytolypa hystricis UAMH7299]|uniref:EKC/KEOPS complex subunit BUD32 n=1 Tax=Polytolypa hystricis (strain UAMH7299) TaxID=1447883 RepID=A0A2B7YQC4_POLH7|nr:BUD32 protein kinase [Polytolypa hystricis UAMH7299]